MNSQQTTRNTHTFCLFTWMFIHPHKHTHIHTHTHTSLCCSCKRRGLTVGRTTLQSPLFSPSVESWECREGRSSQLGCRSNKEGESIGHAMEPRCCHSSRRLPDSHHSSCSMRQQIGKWLFVSNTSALIHQGILFPLTLRVKYAQGCCFLPPLLPVIVCVGVCVVFVLHVSLCL